MEKAMRKGGASGWQAVSEEELRKYTIYSALEIGRVLNGIREERQLIRLRFADSTQESLTAVLAVDVARKRLVLDALPDSRLMALALKGDRLFFEGKHSRISVLFMTGPARSVVFEGAPALEVAFPERLTRLQRRESFRVSVRDSLLRVPDGEQFVCFAVRDVSQTGCCFIDPDRRLQDRVGQVLQGCVLALSGVQELMVALEVCRVFDVPLPNGVLQPQVGCRFVALEAEKAALVQRYVMLVERRNRALTG